ncbi:XrtA system polysaccharide chain length determinant [Hydrogenophaga crocea]|uniref:Chain length-determining protein n=1 Tax=Hydrogenophaga crocea TaxID=2716225 RepID=A0A6G8IFH3_9BURK|nr:XrtA system polysaccharide chain length determinant [Hydrogenophaga crocea]QIM51861.1 chain length-determining protein [Hydrogenophaga crocea]
MHDFIQQLGNALRGMWLYRRTGVIVAWLVAALATVGVMFIPDRFEASARVYVDTQSILRPLMAGLTIQPDVDQQVAMLGRTLISRPTIEKLVESTDFGVPNATKAQRDALVARMMQNIQLKSTGRDNLYTISMRDESPQFALHVVDALMKAFIASREGASSADSKNAREFIDEQIRNYEAKLSEAESRLKDFKLRHIDMQTQGNIDMAARIAENTTQVSQARLELREAESAREAARAQLEQARNLARAATQNTGGFATPEVDARLTELKRNLDGLLQRYTDRHPDVENTRKLIAELEQQKARQVEELRRQAQAAGTQRSGIEANPTVIEMSRTLAAAEVQVASLRARLGEYESRGARIREQAKAAPQIEAELAQLNRDYDVHRKNYEDLVGRRETVALSNELQSDSRLAQFRVVEPPQVGRRPVAPNRVLLMPVVLLAALAAGIGSTLLLSNLRPVFFDAASLRGAVDLPLLGTVTLVRSAQVRQREGRSILRVVASVLALVVLLAIGMVALSIHQSSA